MYYDAEKIEPSIKKILKTVVIIAIVISVFVVLYGYFIILTGEGFTVAVQHPISDEDTVHCEITQEDFKEHPVLEDMIVHRKYVLFSHGVLLDLLVRITPGTYSFSAVHDPDTQFSKKLISYEEFRELDSRYSGCTYNGSVYRIYQTI